MTTHDWRESEGQTKRRRLRRIAARVEALLWITGVVLVGVVTWTLADSYLFQRRASLELEQSWQQERVESAAVGSPVLAAKARPANGTPLAKLSIPRLGVSAVVAEGVDESVLRRALGRIPASALPGEDGNVALAGHRDTFFRKLEGVRIGEELLLETASGRELYRVEWAAVVEPTQVAVAQDTGYPALTLVTCYPFGYVGNAPYRYVIRARRASESSAVAPGFKVSATG